MKYWTSEEKGNEKIIALTDKNIYIGNPKRAAAEHYISDIQMDISPTDNFVGIPLHYIKEIKLQEGNGYIEILFGTDSYESLRILDDKKRSEIFHCFKSNIANAEYSIDRYTKIRAGKKPLIAIVVFTLLFLWTVYIAYGFDHGTDYKVVGEQRSIASIVIVLASLGVEKVVIIFASILTIALVAFIKKSNNPPTIEILKIRR